MSTNTKQNMHFNSSEIQQLNRSSLHSFRLAEPVVQLALSDESRNDIKLKDVCADITEAAELLDVGDPLIRKSTFSNQ